MNRFFVLHALKTPSPLPSSGFPYPPNIAVGDIAIHNTNTSHKRYSTQLVLTLEWLILRQLHLI